jgi:hypothetical protein
MKGRGIFFTVFICLLLLGGRNDPDIANFKFRVEEGGVVVSFNLENGFGKETEQELFSGIKVRFEYSVELKKARTLLPDKRVKRSVVTMSAKYNNLTKQFTLIRQVNGDFTAISITDSLAETKRFLCTVSEERVFSTSSLTPGEKYYLQAKADLKTKIKFFIIPWNISTFWRKSSSFFFRGNGK